MTSTLILFLTYVGYLVIRSSISDIIIKRRISASYSIMAFITVPFSYISVKFFRSLHPLPALTLEMRIGLYLSFLGVLAMYCWLVKCYYSLEKLRQELEEVL